MAAGRSSNSVAGVLTQLSKASNSCSDEQDNEVDDTISIISSTSGSGSTSTGLTSKSTSEARDRDTSKKAPSSLLSVLQQAKTSDLSQKRIIRNNLPPKRKETKSVYWFIFQSEISEHKR